jgi:quinol monooxygenase YgiN
MTRVLAVTWTARLGLDDDVARILGALTPLARSEPGCLAFAAHRSLENPLQFFIYECYVDEEAVREHRESPHFAHYAIEAMSLLEKREHVVYEPIEASS